jgi:hypothetical protein
MLELTHAGMWVKWSGLPARDRYWAICSVACAALGLLPVVLQPWITAQFGGAGFAKVMAGAAMLMAVSALAWWQFSRRQDEMFNRIQNFAIGRAGAGSLAAAFLWWMLSIGGWVQPLPMSVLIEIAAVLYLAHWIYAVRRWA